MLWNHDFGWASWLLMALGMAAFWVLISALGLAILRAPRVQGSQTPSARQILEQRMARGEIDVGEYLERLSVLDHAQR